MEGIVYFSIVYKESVRSIRIRTWYFLGELIIPYEVRFCIIIIIIIIPTLLYIVQTTTNLTFLDKVYSMAKFCSYSVLFFYQIIALL